MEFDQLKAEIKELADIANSVPAEFRQKCFELLLTHLLEKESPAKSEGDSAEKTKGGGGGPGTDIKLPSQVRVFMQRTGVTADQLATVVTQEDGEVHFLREPHNTPVAKGQIDWALLLALKSGFESNSFAVDPEDVRSICQDKGYYDSPNFAANFKNQRAAKLFKGQLEAQGEPRTLTTDGQSALGALIKALASDG